MIREVKREDIPTCVNLIRSSFITVAEEYGITKENAPRFTAFAIQMTDCIGIWIKNTGLCLLLKRTVFYADTALS